ncbi:MAG: nicotinate phosphoribosyltransferase [Spirochaetes bacterium]|nr:nicotinate phosphoribosyltransferase [Spirochaetota bacterium]
MKGMELLTDLYELTMMQVYMKTGIINNYSIFDMFFRKTPFNSGYVVFAGLEQVIEYLQNLSFSKESIDYLYSLHIFSDDFLDYCKEFRFTGSLYSFQEGDLVFPEEPIMRVEAPLGQAQLIETALLNCINFQSLVATKAARVCYAAGGRQVIEFGLRRAQGPDGGISASRASFIGGCIGTSNVYAGQKYGIPVKGTHAHSFVMAYDNEIEAFDNYTKVYPDNSILLVDTYDTLHSGIVNAIAAAKKLAASGRRLVGIRLDSGDLLDLSKKVRKLLDAEGLEYVKIVASNDLDEFRIDQLVRLGAPIDIFGVGTRLATGYPEAALSGVYKMAAIEKNGTLIPKMKVSDEMSKGTIPSRKNVYRYYNSDNAMCFDIICQDNEIILDGEVFDIKGNRYAIDKHLVSQCMHVPIFQNGSLVYSIPSLQDIQHHCVTSMQSLPESFKNIYYPSEYQVYISPGLFNLVESMRSAIHKKNE